MVSIIIAVGQRQEILVWAIAVRDNCGEEVRDHGTIGHQQLYWSHPHKFGQGFWAFHMCSNHHSLIHKYGLNMCHQCFCQYGKDIGFIKLD
ncbi:40S ribosomal protein S29-like [Dromiciops gliroides]|uniref:40S ribosomal protein S29-like n=1 Tax=Dromiciops gliroides TaxID=33562 RepID=UPI001CC58E0F|nr:40S ribosomal protein S29-like [Dromiciops gliroides]